MRGPCMLIIVTRVSDHKDATRHVCHRLRRHLSIDSGTTLQHGSSDPFEGRPYWLVLGRMVSYWIVGVRGQQTVALYGTAQASEIIVLQGCFATDDWRL